MKHPRILAVTTFVLALAALALASPRSARAHCDTLDGPVVKAAEEALAKNDVSRVLIWVQPKDEAEIRAAFQHALDVRKLGPEAKKLADRYFFETLVRVHRAGEGAPYTGLKPAGQDFGPAIPAADRSLAAGDLAPVRSLIHDSLIHGLESRFDAARQASHYAPGDVAAGRKYVAAYVDYIHYVEAVHQVAAHGAAEHGHEEGAAPAHTGESDAPAQAAPAHGHEGAR